MAAHEVGGGGASRGALHRFHSLAIAVVAERCGVEGHHRGGEWKG